MIATCCSLAFAMLASCTTTNAPNDSADAATEVASDAPADASSDVVSDVSSDAPGDAVADTSGGTCSLVGSWRGTLPGGAFAGQQITWTFVAGGTTSGMFGTATISGTWVATGSTATVTDTSSVPSVVACPATQQGVYAISFSPDCATVTWRATSDPCDGRRLAVDTLSVTRQ